MANCATCMRPFMLDELFAPVSGQCWSCGAWFAPGQTGLLLETVQRLDHSEHQTTLMLERLASWPNILIDAHSVLEPIQAALYRPKGRRPLRKEGTETRLIFDAPPS
jgi:hypothetical protein